MLPSIASRFAVLLLAMTPLAAFGTERPVDAPGDLQWWRGNLHTHTLWSDGDSFPEMVVDWYKENGYHFLALSDHNILSEGPKWINPRTNRFIRGRGERRMTEYIERFGEAWVEVHEVDAALQEQLLPLPTTGGHLARRPDDADIALGETVVRLKPLSEFRTFFEEPGRFLLMPAEEVSAAFVVHVNAINVRDVIPAPRGKDVEETLRLAVDAVYEQRERTGQAMFAHVNHPNFRWAITGEQLASVERARFFEVYNGHPLVANSGDETHVGLDRMWDIVLTLRLGELGYGVMYGVATDDAHEYGVGPRAAEPGRGWVMVRSPFLTPEHLVAALEEGNFYSSTGVVLHDVVFDGERYAIEIEPEEGITYRTEFIGTRRGYERSRQPVLDAEENPLGVTQRYHSSVGEILAEVEGLHPTYHLSGDELYVRARIVSSKPKANRYSPDEEWEVAWTQPVVPGS